MVWETAGTAPEGNTSDTENTGVTIPSGADGMGLDQSDRQPDTTPETQMAPESNKGPPSGEGGVQTPVAASANMEAPNTLMEALQRPSIVEEHRTLKGVVFEKVQSAKNGLNEAFTSLRLRGMECNIPGRFSYEKMPMYR